MTMIYIWLAVFVVFLVLEAATAALTSVWFAAGALAALISAFFNVPVPIQLAIFIAVSIVVLLTVRPLARKYVNPIKQPTNADRLIGKECLVIENVFNTEETGLVSIGGKIWTARSQDGRIIEQNTLVRIEKIEGVKLIVSPVENVN